MGSVPNWVWPNVAMMLIAAAYLWWRLVLGTTTRRSTARVIGTVIAGAVAVCGPAALVAQYALPMGTQRVIAWPGWVGYAFVIFLISATVLAEPIRLVAWLRRRSATRRVAVPVGGETVDTSDAGDLDDPAAPTESPPQAVDRRLFLRRVLAAGAVTAATVATAVGVGSAVAGPSVRRATIAIRGLPPAAAGMRVALVSDLHLGPITGREFCREVVDLVNAERPDMICLAGDYTDGTADELAADVQPLADLRSVEGTFAVTGNHEFYHDPDGWLDLLPRLNMRLLSNESVTVRGLLVAGVHDPAGEPFGRGPDLDAALSARADGQPVLLICHSPRLAQEAADRGVDLMVSGHTHGGQFYPAVWIIAATNPVLSGLGEVGSTQVFVTNGAGFWGPASRLGVPADVTLLELVPA